jgi:NADH-quinone oxidoreductase subunit L
MFTRPNEPGLLYVAATLVPLAAFVINLFLGFLRFLGRRYRDQGWGDSLYWLMGGDKPGRGGALLSTGAIGASCLISVYALGLFLTEFPVSVHEHAAHAGDSGHEQEEQAQAKEKAADKHDEHEHGATAAAPAWANRVTWVALHVRPNEGDPNNDARPAVKLELGYRIDHLGAAMFAMVTFVATLIHVFALGYMADETAATVEDHQVHGPDGGHLRRHGRFNRFFTWFSLFCFSMLNLVLADNLFQVFVSWELVGICSFGLIGFYFERQSASNAANKAFITNRVGDAGFIVGLMIIWTYFGTFNFDEIFTRLRPTVDTHGHAVQTPGRVVRADLSPGQEPVQGKAVNFTRADGGSHAILYPMPKVGHFHGGADEEKDFDATWEAGVGPKQYGAIPYWLLCVAGLGIFLGCVGKSAQFPLQVWLPDAMEGPTPVSALVHSATMVAAGVYLVGRCFPLFTPEARLTIAYTGGITLFVAATIAVVATDIKKVLAYSTISQLGYMMLALGIGGWVAGLLHLLTHAFFKALLFLGSGSVIYGCHHEQDLRRMGGLRAKMPVTAGTMLVGVLAIAGTPTFSGWYSKDAIIAEALSFSLANPSHCLLLLLPLVTAGITCFYMFRMWFMTFTGEARDHHVYEHARESPRVMTVPLIVLACFSYFVAIGWPIWDAEASYLGAVLRGARPAAVSADFAALHDKAHELLPAYHNLAGVLALAAAAIGAVFAVLVYLARTLDPAEAVRQFPGVYRLLENKWYFDEAYSVLVVRPSLVVAQWCRDFDTKYIDGFLNGTARATVETSRGSGRFDSGIVDGLANLIGDTIFAAGVRLRAVQTGQLRNYVLFLVLAAVGLFVLLTYFVNLAAAH